MWANVERVKSNFILKSNLLKQGKFMKTTEILQAKRRELKEISNTLRDAKTNGEIQTINEGLKQIYSEQGHSDLKTYEEWKQQGMQVKRNEKALYLWRRQTEKTIDENGEQKTITFFPMIALFSENQVYQPSKNH